MKRLYLPLLIILFFVHAKSFAQDIPVKRDSLDQKTVTTGGLPKHVDSLRSDFPPLRFPRLNPAENLLPQFTPHQRFSLTPLRTKKERNFPPINWHGAAPDFINTKSRTAIASTMPMPNLLTYSSATLGLVETPFFGKGNFYILNAGANYRVSPALNVGMSGSYHSNFGITPFWNAGVNASYAIYRDLTIDGGLTYIKTAGNMLNVNQSAILVDLHSRYRLSDDWFLNAYGGMPVKQNNNQSGRLSMMPMMNTPYYGGSFEYWFQPTMGVEAGLIWKRDMFSGKMRPQPKLELLFRPGK